MRELDRGRKGGGGREGARYRGSKGGREKRELEREGVKKKIYVEGENDKERKVYKSLSKQKHK